MEVDIPQRLGAEPELQREMNAVVVFDITGPSGGKWTLDTTRTADWVKPGADGAAPKTTLTCSDKDFVAVCTQKLNATMAVAMGKLKFKPMDTNLALKLAKLIG
ncbi:MAG TPA: SCP2 sterol-binding domain-containing protein [Myxococcales bacterium]